MRRTQGAKRVPNLYNEEIIKQKHECLLGTGKVGVRKEHKIAEGSFLLLVVYFGRGPDGGSSP